MLFIICENFQSGGPKHWHIVQLENASIFGLRPFSNMIKAKAFGCGQQPPSSYKTYSSCQRSPWWRSASWGLYWRPRMSILSEETTFQWNGMWSRFGQFHYLKYRTSRQLVSRTCTRSILEADFLKKTKDRFSFFL